jgi:5-formyltetrahydrofolate cyclo-ligase
LSPEKDCRVVTDTAKTALRARMKDVRGTLPADQRLALAHSLAAFAAALPRTSIVSGYLPIRDELDPRPLMAELAARGAQLSLPVMVGRTSPLLFRAWSPGDAMDTVAWGIQEPKADRPTLIPDLMLVPLLAIDRGGNRLGYGAGHYDRTIGEARRHKPVITIGLAFDTQIIDAVPHMPYDVALDYILTPSGLIRCQGSA